MKSLVALSLAVFMIGIGCTNDKPRGIIEMETYYMVFDGIKILENHKRRAFVKIPRELIPPMSYGRSVFVYFENSDGGLIPRIIDTTSPSEENIEPYLEMRYMGCDSVSGKFGMTLEPISAFIHDKTAMVKNKAKIIEVEFFAAENGNLEFVSLQLKNTINKDPLFIK